MNKIVKRIMAAGVAALMIAGSMTACSGSSSSSSSTAESSTASSESTASSASSTASSETTTKDANVSGTITLAGSTSMEKLCEAMSEAFMEAYPDVTVTVEYTGSGAGIESVTSGSVDIGDSSRSLTDDEKAKGAVENIVAIDGIAVITDTDNTVTNLTTEELAKIYTGEITNWKELGGNDENIVVIGREAGSGTRGAFEELLEVDDKCAYAQELDSTGAVLAKVASTPGAIGYVSLDVVDDSVNAVSLNDVEATEANILAGDYLLSRPFVMATMGEISEQSELVQTWFSYIESDEGQSVISDLGLILPQ